MQRAIVTGASGLIGSALVERLRSDGVAVTRLVRRTPGVDEAQWDPSGGTIDAGALAGADAVFHLAGEGIGNRRWSANQKRRILESRTLGTSLLARTLADLSERPAVLVSGSAIGFYGDRGDEVLVESSNRGTGFLADVCVGWEAATAPAEDAGIRVVHARTGIVFAEKGGALSRLVLPFRLFAGGRLGSGRQWMSWISLRDEVSALIHLATTDVHGAANIVAPAPARNADLARIVGRVLHRPSVLPVPAFGPRLLLGKELADQLLFASQRVEPAVLTASGFTFADPELEPALRDLLG